MRSLRNATAGWAAAVLLALPAAAVAAEEGAMNRYASPLVPAPAAFECAGPIAAPALAGIAADPKDPLLAERGAFAAQYLGDAAGRVLAVGSRPGHGILALERDDGLEEEAYRLTVADGAWRLAASGVPGFSRGLATVFQLLTVGAVPAEMSIADGPAFPWRGLLLDCGRHFQPVAVVEGVIDRMALLKMNVLHWHLTEDQGWRCEVPALPRLTEVAAWRDDPGRGRYGGFYTTGDMRHIVDYAAQRGIRVVPEIEMPGHSQAALAAYPELSCTGGPFAVQTQWGIHPDIYCAGNEAVFEFLETVLDHVLDVFPSPDIHVGGDEAPRDRWHACPRCRERMRNEGLADEDELQAWFLRRIEAYLAGRGRRMVGWDEILDGDLAGRDSQATVQAWRGIDRASEAVGQGLDTVVSPTSHAYFDYDPGLLDLQQVHGFDPVPAGLDEAARQRIRGGAANLWTERIPPGRVDAVLFPRLTAMAEALWSAPAERDFPEFLSRTRRLRPALERLGVRPGPAARPLRLRPRPGEDGFTVAVDPDERVLRAFEAAGVSVRGLVVPRGEYRPDRHPETQALPLIPPDAPIVGQDPWTIPLDVEPQLAVAQLFIAGVPYGAPGVCELHGHAAVGRPVRWTDPPDPRYRGSGATDGVLGTYDFRDGVWSGFEGRGVTAEIDLQRTVNVRRLEVRAFMAAHDWIFLPGEVSFSLEGGDGHWRTAGTATHDVDDRHQDVLIHTFAVDPDGMPARRVRVRAEGAGPCPGWHPGAGRPSWIFLDEIVVIAD